MLKKNPTFKGILLFRRPGNDFATHDITEKIRAYAYEQEVPFALTLLDLFGIMDNPDDPILIISVGGDGTMLAAMRASARFLNATVVGFNTGTLGFLTDKIPASIPEFLTDIWFDRNVVIDERMMLKGTVAIDGDVLDKNFVTINEFVLAGSTVNVPLTTEVYINDDLVSEQMGSGVLVATSTGSTAMSLSAGGAIVSPSTNIMQIVPVLPHTLTARPIISTGRDSITLAGFFTDRISEIEIHGDGQVLQIVSNLEGSEVSITIEKHEKTVKVWRPKDWNFFSVLSEKMKW